MYSSQKQLPILSYIVQKLEEDLSGTGYRSRSAKRLA